MSGENSQGWITEEAFLTISPCARQVRQRKEVKMKQLSPAWKLSGRPCSRTQAAKVLSLEETAQAQACWPDRGHPLGPYLATASHRGAVPRQDSISRVLQTLTSLTSSHILHHLPGRAFYDSPAVMDTSCSLGMYSRRLTLETRSSEKNHSSSECRPMESQESLVVFGCTCKMARENGGTVFLLQPEAWGSRRPSWSRVFWF